MMAENATHQIDDPSAAAESADSPGRFSLLAKLKVLLFIAGVIVVECMIAYLWLPDSAQTAAMASAALQAKAQTADLLDQQPDAPDKQELADQIEVDLGEFSVTSFQPVSNTTLRIDFHLFGTVNAEDEKQFLALMEENLHRFREQVIVTVRSADITDLTDAGLGLVKRKILEKTNRTLGKPLLRVVIFSEFSFIEQ